LNTSVYAAVTMATVAENLKQNICDGTHELSVRKVMRIGHGCSGRLGTSVWWCGQSGTNRSPLPFHCSEGNLQGKSLIPIHVVCPPFCGVVLQAPDTPFVSKNYFISVT
jgi:hypothetical protein